VEPNSISVYVKATYEVTANSPGAPSQQPQLRPETDQLSSVWQELSQVPSETALLPNYPNTFNPETWIPYHLAEPTEVTLTIYFAVVRLVRTLALGLRINPRVCLRAKAVLRIRMAEIMSMSVLRVVCVSTRSLRGSFLPRARY